MGNELKKIPYLGVGIGLRNEVAEKTLEHSKEIDVLEIISEQFFSHKPPENHAFLSRFKEKFPIIPHGVKLSIGSIMPLEDVFMDEIKLLLNTTRACYYSDHFALTRHGVDLDTNHLSPIWHTKETLEYIIKKIDTIQQKIGVPLVLENITAPFDIAEADFDEPEFIEKVCERTGCGLLLDLTNIHINAFNRGKDALTLLKHYPLHAVVQVHLAGGELDGNNFKDTHSQELTGPNEGVWELLSWIEPRASIKAVIIERDENFKPDFEEMLLNDVRHARTIMEARDVRETNASLQSVRTP